MDVISWIALAGLLGISTGVASLILFICPELLTINSFVLTIIFIAIIIIIRKFITWLLNKTYDDLDDVFDLDFCYFPIEHTILYGLCSLIAGIISLIISYNGQIPFDVLSELYFLFSFLASGCSTLGIIITWFLVLFHLTLLFDINDVISVLLFFVGTFGIMLGINTGYLFDIKIVVFFSALLAIVCGIEVIFVRRVYQKRKNK